MSRDTEQQHGCPRRVVVVWLAVTAVTVGGVRVALPRVTALDGPGRLAFDDALVAACATVLLLALVWAWSVTTTTIVSLARGHTPSRSGLVRRLVLIACGAATLAPTAAAAGQDQPPSGLDGLPFPDRSVSAPREPGVDPSGRPRAASSPAVVVRPGDSLWSIAVRTAAPRTSVDQRWRAIVALNREVVGPDPDLIVPGQRLLLPEEGGR